MSVVFVSPPVYRKLTTATEKGCDAEYSILAILLRERGTLSNGYTAAGSHRKFCGQTEGHCCAHRD